MMIGRVASVALALGFAITAASSGDEATRARGSWSINNWIPGDEVHLVLEQGTSRSRWEWGSSQHLADLKGLTREQLRATRAEVSFTLERDAGVFFLTGTSKLGFASGEFHFVGSPDYAGKLAALGYETIGQDELLDMAIRDISLDFAAAVRTAGVNDAKVGDLARLRDHGVEVPFLRDLASVGQPLDVDMVLELRDHGVDGRFVRDLVAVGNPNVGIAHAVTLHDRGV